MRVGAERGFWGGSNEEDGALEEETVIMVPGESGRVRVVGSWAYSVAERTTRSAAWRKQRCGLKVGFTVCLGSLRRVVRAGFMGATASVPVGDA